MSNQDTQTLIGAIVTDEKRPGTAFRCVEAARGWLTLEDEDGNQHKARPGQLAVVDHDEGEEAAEEAEASRKMAATLNRYKAGYQETTAYSGAKSQNNGDEIATFLAGLEPSQVMAIAEKVLGLEPGELSAKYDRLNPGQKRMNSGNRIRAAVKRGDVTVDEVKQAYKH